MHLDISRCGRYCISRCLHPSLVCLFKDGSIHRWGLPKSRKWFILPGKHSWFIKHMDTSCRGIANGIKNSCRLLVWGQCQKSGNVGMFDDHMVLYGTMKNRRFHTWWRDACCKILPQISSLQRMPQSEPLNRWWIQHATAFLVFHANKWPI